MKNYFIVFVWILPCFLALKSDLEVSPKDILSGKYKKLLSDKLEYNQHIEKYNKAILAKKTAVKQLDRIFTVETLALWPIEEQKKLKTILNLAKNNISGDVYIQLQAFGAEYAFTLNKILKLTDVYALERDIIRANNQIKETENWATTVAEITQYFYQDFLKGKLNESLSHYASILQVEKRLQEISATYKDNITAFIEKEKNAKSFYYEWRRWNKFIKKSPQRDTLYKHFEQRFSTSPR